MRTHQFEKESANTVNIFDRASRGMWLSPFERAALRLLEGIAASGFVAGAVAVLPLLGGNSVDWPSAGRVFLAAAVTAMLLAVLKYARAFGDAPLPVPPRATTVTPPITKAG